MIPLPTVDSVENACGIEEGSVHLHLAEIFLDDFGLRLRAASVELSLPEAQGDDSGRSHALARRSGSR